MKKIIIFVFSIFLSCMSCFASEASNLYLIKDAEKIAVQGIADSYFAQMPYAVVKNENYLLYPPATYGQNDVFHVILLKPQKSDIYLYYYTNDSASAFDDVLLNFVKARKYKVKNIKNKELKSLFHTEAIDFKSKNVKATRVIYDFSETAQKNFSAKNNKISQVVVSPSTVLEGHLMIVPSRSTFNATMQSSINTESISENDIVAATLTEDWKCDGVVVAPAGSVLYGKVLESESAGGAYKNGELALMFEEILTPKGQTIKLTANAVKIKVSAASRALQITGGLVAGTVVGAGVGALYVVLSGGNVATGALCGAGAGFLVAGLIIWGTDGKNIEIPEGTQLRITLKEPLTTYRYE